MNIIRLNYIDNIDSVFKKEEFILSALNLSFLCFFFNKTITNHRKFIMWPDGIYGKFLTKSKKIPGSKLIQNLCLPSSIKNIIVIGSLNTKEKFFLKKKFNIKIQHRNLPIGKVEDLKKRIFINSSKDDLILITLPTPMQEEIAKYILNKFKIKKIICIGGGLAIASGSTADVPKFLSKLGMEFLWRLRTDKLRRLKRLFYTFFVYHYLNIFFIFKKIKFIKI
jgi:UDP-N-acetyl-D-mannosaminuronic acid transferase (WecB/TagA/CpsF family)